MPPATCSERWSSSASSTRPARCWSSIELVSDRGRFLVFQFMGRRRTRPILALAAGQVRRRRAGRRAGPRLGDSSDTVFDAGVYGLQMFAIRREQGRLAEVLPLMRVAVGRPGEARRSGVRLTVLYADSA